MNPKRFNVLYKTLILSLLLSLPAFADKLYLQEGFVAAHTQIMFGGGIDPLNTGLQADLSINENDISSLTGKFWIAMELFSSDDKGRDEHMHESTQTQKYPLATYTLSKVTKIEGNNNYSLEGTLNFFGQDRPLTAKSQIILDKGILSIKATSKISMNNYGLEMPCLVFICVEDNVDLFIKAVLAK